MALQKIFTFLKTLHPEEVTGFFKYLKQTQGKDSIPVHVFDYYRQFYPDFSDAKKMDTDYAYDKIFRKRGIPEQGPRTNLNNTLSDLNLALKDFLIAEKVRTDKHLAELLWTEILYERNLQEHFSKQADALYQKTISQNKIQSDDTLKNSATVILQFRNLSENVKSMNIGAMQECLNMLSIYLETVQYKMACLLANNKKMLPKESVEDDSIGLPESPEGIKSVLLNIYRDIYQMIRTEDNAIYSRIETLLTANFEHIDADELDGIMRFLGNFIAAKVRKTNASKWNAMQHQLNVFSLKHGIFMRNGHLGPTRFTNIIDVACAANELQWAESFISEYGSKLPEIVRQVNIDLGNSILLFKQDKFREILDLLPIQQLQSEAKDFNYIMRARWTILRCYFEVKEDSDIIMNYCVALETILLRIPKPRKEAVEALLEFTRICKTMLMQKVEKEALIKRIETSPNVFASHWLLKHAQQYKKI